ncbi:MAG: bleomycin resistance protein [Phycisphaerales bacterium]|nr:bleomycin resistance protein [Phycisphaerales bacterium]
MTIAQTHEPAPGIAAIGIEHVNIYTGDVERSRQFYGQILGLKEVPRPDWFDFPGAWFCVGGQHLHLTYANPLPPRTQEHFCIQVADLASAQAHLEARGMLCRPDRDYSHTRRFVIFDPDGNYIEISEIKRAAQL